MRPTAQIITGQRSQALRVESRKPDTIRAVPEASDTAQTHGKYLFPSLERMVEPVWGSL